MSSAPFFSTTGTENWLADSPRPPLPESSGTTDVCCQTASDGF